MTDCDTYKLLNNGGKYAFVRSVERMFSERASEQRYSLSDAMTVCYE